MSELMEVIERLKKIKPRCKICGKTIDLYSLVKAGIGLFGDEIKSAVEKLEALGKSQHAVNAIYGMVTSILAQHQVDHIKERGIDELSAIFLLFKNYYEVEEDGDG